MTEKAKKTTFWKILLRTLLGVILTPILAIVIILLTYMLADRTNGKISVAGETRRYLLYVPPSYDPQTPTPLVINIHGFSQWPANQANVSQWSALADDVGFIVVYPSGTGFPKRWQTLDTPQTPGGPDKELAFYNALLDRLQEEYNLDTTRIYANGLSNGGGMSLLLACRLSERITAIGGVAGAYLQDLSACEQGRTVPAIFFHGMADEIVPYDGGPAHPFEVSFKPVPDFIASYAAHNGCSAETQALPANGAVSGVRYSSCTQNTEVHFYTIADGGHTWPGGKPLPAWITGKTSPDINATRVMWEFFRQYTIQE